MENLLAMILAGGQGSRLQPLTRDRAKPAVHFAGKYRVIDFVLNNFVNSGHYRIKVLTQFKSDSLNRHVATAWDMNRNLDQYVDLVPAQMRMGEHWYLGTADAVWQNLYAIERERPRWRARALLRIASNSSRLRPEPTATHVSGDSARCVGMCVSWRSR